MDRWGGCGEGQGFGQVLVLGHGQEPGRYWGRPYLFRVEYALHILRQGTQELHDDSND